MDRTSEGPGTLELLDGGIALLRRAPAYAWLWWASGALPFVLALLTLIAEMSGNAEAVYRLAGHSLIVAAAYTWMGCTQSMFCLALRALLSADTAPRVSIIRALRAQSFVHATALLVMPIAFISLIGAPWTVAFYQSAAAYPYGTARSNAGQVFRYAAREAFRWPVRNTIALLTVIPLALAAFLNIGILLVAGPLLFRTFTGQESDFTRAPGAMLNLTVLSAAVLITWLSVDPLLKAMYAIRCFRADSLRTGADLRAELKSAAPRAAAALSALMLAGRVRTAGAAETAVDAHQLERAIREVTRRPEYLWHAPRIVTPQGRNPLGRFTEDITRWWSDVIASVFRWVGHVVELLLKSIFGKGSSSSSDAGSVTPASVEALMIGLLVLVGALVVYLLVQRSRSRKAKSTPPATPALDAVDIAREDISPDQLPDDEWLALAETWISRGDLRMATRAIFLSLLASLGTAGVISIHKAKSNLDYLRELSRRTRGNPTPQESFRRCIRVFERTWYGGHEISSDLLDGFRTAATNTRSSAQQA